MQIQIETSPAKNVAADWLVVGVSEAANDPGPLAEIDQALSGRLTRMREAGDLALKLAQVVPVYEPAGLTAKRLLLVGLGAADALTPARFEKAMKAAARSVSDKKNVRVAVAIPAVSLAPETCAEIIANSFTVGCVGQDLYRAEKERYEFDALVIAAADAKTLQACSNRAQQGHILGQAMNLARELVNRSAEDIYPESFAQRAQQEAAAVGLSCEILDEARLKSERMGSLLAVAQGSARPPRVAIVEYRGGKQNDPTLALVGKGVTFDSGGLSIKTTDNMLTMKCDMAGAATVLGALTAIARLKLPVNVTGYMGLVENMVSGTSYKLGDVLTARNGVTIEVLNTDAEGRLVLADVLALAVDRGAAKLIDLATLTGACMVALGEDVTGAFTNNQAWCDVVVSSAQAAGEPIWQLPMFDEYAENLKSDVADCKNVGPRWGGAITAAKFLEKFVGGKPWVHLDIAGPSFASNNKPFREGGATGCMLRTIVEAAGRFAKSTP